MWQRIQTVWWILSILAVTLFGLQDILYFRSDLVGGAALFVQTSTGVALKTDLLDTGALYTNWTTAILLGFSVVISLTSIFIYKMRPFQLRLSILNALVLVGALLSVGYTAYRFSSTAGASFSGVSMWLSLPFIAIILQLLAARAVLQDEMLVRMSQRIR